jgi:acetyl esterase/lipase
MSKLLFSLVLLFALPAHAEVNVTREIHYGPDALQTVDVYQPGSCKNKSCPVTMWVHGGGWKRGDTGGQKSTDMQKTWASQGIVMVGVNYRLSPEHMHPTHVQDVAAAINWVHQNIGQYGGDQNRISLLGHSAGAHLVALVATNPRFLAAYNLWPKKNIVNVFPVDTASFDLTNPSRFVAKRVKSAFGRNDATLRDASPVWNVTSGGSYPSFIITAAQVRKDAVATSETLQKKLRSAGAFADLMVINYPGVGQLKAHGMIAAELADLNSSMTKALLERVLKGS